MFYDAVANVHGLPHDPFQALVAPRPIGWISTISKSGQVNLAPYSYFNAVSNSPHVVMFSSTGRKNSMVNAQETGEFVCNLVTYDLSQQMVKSSAVVDADVDKMSFAGLASAPSKLVAPPRVAASPVALECKYLSTVEVPLKADNGRVNYMVLGQVVGIYIDDSVIVDGLVDAARLKTVSRLGYLDYAVVENIFSLERP